MHEIEWKILTCMFKIDVRATKYYIANLLGLQSKNLNIHLEKLVEKGLILTKKIDFRKGVKKSVYWINKENIICFDSVYVALGKKNFFVSHCPYRDKCRVKDEFLSPNCKMKKLLEKGGFEISYEKK